MSRHRVFRRAGAALVALWLVALPVCAPPTADPIDNTSWKMESIGPPGDLTPVIEGTNVSLQFVRKEHVVTGSTGCNAFQGTYEVDGPSLTINYDIGPGQRCDLSAIVEQEQMFLATIVNAESYVSEGDTLTIDCGDRVLVFARR